MHCWSRILLKSDIVCRSYDNVYRGLLFSWTQCISYSCRKDYESQTEMKKVRVSTSGAPVNQHAPPPKNNPADDVHCIVLLYAPRSRSTRPAVKHNLRGTLVIVCIDNCNMHIKHIFCGCSVNRRSLHVEMSSYFLALDLIRSGHNCDPTETSLQLSCNSHSTHRSHTVARRSSRSRVAVALQSRRSPLQYPTLGRRADSLRVDCRTPKRGT